MIVVEEPRLMLLENCKIIPARAPITIIKSKLFQESIKNLRPKPVSFIIASKVKIAAKM